MEEVPFALSTPGLDVRLDQGQPFPPADLFKHPFVVEVMGAGFDKPANTRYSTLRFPRVQKVHQGRTFKDTVSFDELQELARRSIEVPHGSESEEDRQWLEKLQRANLTPKTLAKNGHQHLGTV